MTYNQYTFKKDCHAGNTAIYQHTNGKCLFIGGFAQGAVFDGNTFVIDLTGNEYKYWDIPFAYTPNAYSFLQYTNTFYAGWLSLPFPDYSTPKNLSTREQWEGIAYEIVKQLESGHDVLVACHGGHGRSGLFCSIVGYILNVEKDRSWSSPVEKVRKIHCSEAIETYTQEKYVYDILGLNIVTKHVYVTATTKMDANDPNNFGTPCPICGSPTYYFDQYGMCVTCQRQWAQTAPVKDDLTLQDIKEQMPHQCNSPKCAGIWTARICGHTTHNMLLYDGYCEWCWDKIQEEREWAEKKAEIGSDTQVSQTSPAPKVSEEACAICEVSSHFSKKYGVCYTCARDMMTSGQVELVHNSITDPYRTIPHHCDIDTPFCCGIMQADVCLHVVHNREVYDGLCPECIAEKEAAKNEDLHS